MTLFVPFLTGVLLACLLTVRLVDGWQVATVGLVISAVWLAFIKWRAGN